MKKFIVTIIVIFIIILAGVYCLLFTPPGNGIVKGIIEKKLNEKVPVKVTVKDFKLTPNYFFIKILVKNNSYIKADGNYSLFSKNIDAKYEIKLIDLSKFEKLINYRLNGNFYTKGTCVGNEKLLKVNGITTVAESSSKYEIVLKNLNLTGIGLNFKKLKIAKLLYMLNLPSYADGFIDITGKIADINKGKINVKIYNTKLFAKVLNKEFSLNLTKNIKLKAYITNRLVKDAVKVKADIITSLANIKLPELTVNLKNNSISGNYILSVSNLMNLYDITKTKLRGKVLLNGNILKTADNIKATGKTKLFNGDVNFVFNKNIFNLNLKKVKSNKILYTLYYPQMFDSTGDGFFKYNILKKTGNFDFKFKNGRLIKKNLTFIPRTIVGLIYVFTGVDLTKELFKITNLDGKIDNNVINANLYLKSKLAEIMSKNAIIDINRETIKALVNLKIGNVKLDVLVAGKLSKPSIKLNPGKLILNRPELKNLKKEKKKLKKTIKNLFGQ